MHTRKHAKPRGWPFAALAVVLAMLANSASGDGLRAAGVNAWFTAFAQGWPLLLNIVDLAAIIVCLWVVGGVAPARQWHITGLARPVGAAALFAAILFVPAIAVLMIVSSPAANLDPADLIFGGLVFPMFEEVVFRGLATGVLMRHFGWRFLPAALLPSLFFGAFHMWQGDGLEESLTIAAFTAFGGVWFGWIYWKWDFNLWPAFFLHAGLNLLWPIFALGDTALGGQLGNIIRVSVILGSVALTIWAQPLIGRIAGSARQSGSA